MTKEVTLHEQLEYGITYGTPELRAHAVDLAKKMGDVHVSTCYGELIFEKTLMGMIIHHVSPVLLQIEIRGDQIILHHGRSKSHPIEAVLWTWQNFVRANEDALGYALSKDRKLEEMLRDNLANIWEAVNKHTQAALT